MGCVGEHTRVNPRSLTSYHRACPVLQHGSDTHFSGAIVPNVSPSTTHVIPNPTHQCHSSTSLVVTSHPSLQSLKILRILVQNIRIQFRIRYTPVS